MSYSEYAIKKFRTRRQALRIIKKKIQEAFDMGHFEEPKKRK